MGLKQMKKLILLKHEKVSGSAIRSEQWVKQQKLAHHRLYVVDKDTGFNSA